MSRIRILSEHLANQIAAGEVVERPASVVKELLENALDAGASRIDIQVEGGGTRLIRIADNGDGMDGDDVLLALERHATSKLLDESQLAAIATLGFRGEALPSIGSVSRMTILSRTRQGTTGTRADIRYGILHAVHEDGCAKGTIIEVRSLFGNLPARKKFLKTKRTELSHIDEVIRSQSLAHPQVAFSLQVDGRQLFSFAATDLHTRVCDVFRYNDTLIPVEAATDDEQQLSVNGYLLLPDVVVSSRLRILVNNRPVQDRMIRHAVMEGLQGFLMKGHQPAGALLLQLSPELVDVNVHPAKREIRFRNASSVHRFLVRAVADAIQNHQEQVRGTLFHVPDRPDTVDTSADAPVATPQEPVQHELPTHPQAPPLARQPDFPPSCSALSTPKFLDEDTAFIDNNKTCEPQVTGAIPSEESSKESFEGLILIGQFLNLYLLCERDGQLIVIDQHAAHERILYQRLRHGYDHKELASQTLLFPVTVDLGSDHVQTLEKEEDAVKSLGMDVTFFGDSTWVIKAIPALVAHLAPQEVLFDILDGLRNRSSAGLSGVVPECIDNLLASMACKAAIKAGNRLQPKEMIELLQQMEKSDVFSHCPHGRPVIKIFSSQDVEKWFHRT